MIKKVVIFFVWVLSVVVGYGQCSVWSIDGFVYECKKDAVDSGYVVVLNSRGRELVLDTSDVFAVIRGGDTTFLYNNPGYPIDRAKIFMMGQIDGRSYRNWKVSAGAFATGFLSPILLAWSNFPTFVSPIFAGIYTAAFSGVNMNKDQNGIRDNLSGNMDYRNGYEYSATRQKVKNSALFSTVGLVTGFSAVLLIESLSK